MERMLLNKSRQILATSCFLVTSLVQFLGWIAYIEIAFTMCFRTLTELTVSLSKLFGGSRNITFSFQQTSKDDKGGAAKGTKEGDTSMSSKKEEEKLDLSAQQAVAVLGIGLIAMGEEIGSQMSLRMFGHLVSCYSIIIRSFH